MMTTVLDLAQQRLTKPVVDQLGTHLGESSQAISKAVLGALPTVLGQLTHSLAEPGGYSLLTDMIKQVNLVMPPAGDHEAEDSLLGMLSGSSGQLNRLLATGSSITASLFGPTADLLINSLAEYSSVRSSSAAATLSLTSSVLLSVLGKQTADEKAGEPSVLTRPDGGSLQAAVPADFLIHLRTIPGLTFLDSPATTAAEWTGSSDRATSVSSNRLEDVPTYFQVHPQENKGGGQWLPWLILLLGSALFVFTVRACQRENSTDPSTTGAAHTRSVLHCWMSPADYHNVSGYAPSSCSCLRAA
ncbi:DUF937 domain-containing protein [Spirosoma sp. 209]|uniref:DUF937 domain-containing protein n=1 Tax=Spirosoma sp. 209 TaxID=1955701 RepID=UPI00098D2FFC|nr:DUF937 domain-containing protein [Spirosoma sp. 209]